MMSENLNKFQACVKSLARDVTAETALDLSGEYERCIALDAALSGDRPSVYGRDLGKKLSQAFYLLGLALYQRKIPRKLIHFSVVRMNARFIGLQSCNWNRWSDARKLCGYEDVSLYLKDHAKRKSFSEKRLDWFHLKVNLRRVYEGPLEI